ncbi:MAG TPA: hypothetical protein VGE43_04385 [Acidimicrobiales bacterium]
MTPVSADSSASYAAEVARLLWPEPWEAPYVTRDRYRAGQAHRDAYLFPSVRRPRLLVPADLPGSASMLQRLGGGRSALAGPVRRMLERSVRSGAFAHARWPMLRVPATESGADSIERHLGDCFGTEVRVGVLLGTRRVNQKPVLQVFDRAGDLLGYAKVGHNELTADLVKREAASLATVARQAPTTFRAPAVLHHGRWSGLEVLVISPLVTTPRREVSTSVRRAAMREVAAMAGTASRPLAESVFWGRIRAAAELLTDQPDGARLHSALTDLEAVHGGELVDLGGWHGDWGRWNMGMGEGGLMVWDWERYDSRVPLGFDGLHFLAQSVRPGQRDQERQEETFLRSAPYELAELGVDPARHELTLRLYLLEIGIRYAEALTHSQTPALVRRTAWVLSLLTRLSPSPATGPTEGR